MFRPKQGWSSTGSLYVARHSIVNTETFMNTQQFLQNTLTTFLDLKNKGEVINLTRFHTVFGNILRQERSPSIAVDTFPRHKSLVQCSQCLVC